MLSKHDILHDCILDFTMCVSTKINNFSSYFYQGSKERVQYVVDPRNAIFARVRTPGPWQDRRLCIEFQTEGAPRAKAFADNASAVHGIESNSL